MEHGKVNRLCFIYNQKHSKYHRIKLLILLTSGALKRTIYLDSSLIFYSIVHVPSPLVVFSSLIVVLAVVWFDKSNLSCKYSVGNSFGIFTDDETTKKIFKVLFGAQLISLCHLLYFSRYLKRTLFYHKCTCPYCIFFLRFKWIFFFLKKNKYQNLQYLINFHLRYICIAFLDTGIFKQKKLSFCQYLI